MLVFLLVAALAVLGLLLLLKQNGKPDQGATRLSDRRIADTSEAPTAPLVAPLPTPNPAPAQPTSPTDGLRSIVRLAGPQLEAMLQGFEVTRAADLPATDAAAIRALLARIPRPPSALHKLISPTFVANANTAELSEMVVAEPQVAAKVLAMVNSPFFGLKAPLASIGQAVTFLGMNTVRSVCLKYLLDASFRSNDPEVKKTFDVLWNASAFASELCLKLAQQLQLPEPGALVTQVVLNFLGPVTSHSLLPRSAALGMASKSFLERTRLEQEQLGLCAAELGGLLMQQWQLPQSIIDPVRDIDRVLLEPCTATATPQQARKAFCYLCARLGEMLAHGKIKDLARFELAQEPGPDLYYLQTYLQQPGLERLQEALRRPEIVSAINAISMAMHSNQKN
jgi:HD-like signal output (HDOD) protein